MFCPGADLRAFDAETGQRLWTLPSDSSFSLAEGTADAERVFAATKTRIVAADAATGEVLWQRGLSGQGWVDTWIRSLTLSDGELLVALEGWYNSNGFFSSAVIVALDPATGAERWRYEDGGPETDRSIGGLTLWDGLILYSDVTEHEAVAVDRATREVVWRVPWTPGFIGVLRAPLVADGTAYFSDGGGGVFAVDARTGALRWQNDVQGGHFSHELCGPYVIGNNGRVELFDRADGSHEGRLFDGVDEIALQLAVGAGRLYVGTNQGVYAFDCNG